MRALLATTGSHGDVRPFYALAKELQRRGHDVLLAAPDHYAREAATHGIPFRKHGPPWVEAEMAETFRKVLALSNPLDQVCEVMDAVAGPEREAVPELIEMARAADVVISPPILVAGTVAARVTNVPHVSVQFAPVHPARNYGPTGDNLGPFFNRLAFSVGKWLVRRATDAKLNTIVAAGGLEPWRDVLISASYSRLLDLIAVSPHVMAHDPDWPAASKLTGYWRLDEPSFVLDPKLEAFLAGARPVVIGFGSMHGFDTDKAMSAILEAASGSPHKFVIQSGWAGLRSANLPSNVHLAGFVPHEQLFPRASCVIHHGGAGTTAAVLRAGVPQAIVWHLGDQPAWGKRVKQLGVGPAAVFHRKLTGKWLRAQIDRMTSDAKMQGAARDLGQKIQAERGVETAVSLIEAAISP